MSTTTTTRTQHTPGPWKAYRCGTRDGFTVAQAPAAGRDAIAANIAQVGPFPADARLIAAAPELLAALQDILADAQRVKLAYFTQAARAEVEARFARARAVIAKVEGAS